MDFFRKLFPLIKRKNMVRENKGYNIEDTELSLDQISSQLDDYSNDEQSMLNTKEDNHIKDDNDDELDSNKILATLTNVTPIKIYPNITENGSNDIEIISDDMPENGVFAVEINVSDNDNTTSNNVIQIYDRTENEQITQETGIYDITLNTAIDDKTLKDLREFEETLNNFEKTACLSKDSVGEVIDLDEFHDLFDKLDTLGDDLNSQITSTRNSFEQNNESAICCSSNTQNFIENSTDLEKDSRIPENIDIISINSSTEEEKSLVNEVLETISINSDSEEDNSECDGYNSSDFEFISETEANLDGFIINFRREYNPENEGSQESSELSPFFSQAIEERGDSEKGVDPGEGPSGLNRQKHEFEDRSYRNNHVIPVGDEYLALFQGIYNPLLPISEIFFLENKSVRASAMNVQYDGIGFDKQLAQRRPPHDSSEDEFEDEAKECANKILNVYPGENRKRRRRY